MTVCQPCRMILVSILWCVADLRSASPYAELRVVDADSGRGVPLVELETVNRLQFVTDNAGRVAINEPGWFDREIFFYVKSHGYSAKKDGFGYVGARVKLNRDEPATITIKRTNVAERLCRLTGEGRYRDTQLLGHDLPQPESPHPGNVAGQDSIQAAVYRNRIYCFWGDTQRLEYPLGLFRMAGATLPLLPATFDPAAGLPYDYFTDATTGFARAMMPIRERKEGVVWVSALAVVPDAAGVDKLVGHYTRRKGLVDELEHGICIYNDATNEFDVAVQRPLTETWRKPAGHPIMFEDAGQRWLLFGSPHPNVRVPATLAAVLDLHQYEAFTCSPKDGAGPDLRADHTPRWRWQKELPPTDAKQEHQWVQQHKLGVEAARFVPTNAADPQERILLHNGTVRWNEHRQRWIMIANQSFSKTSVLGEVWYAEADQPTGPFVKAVKVVTHDKYTFYNVCQHSFLDRADGRFIHFEGTYTQEFSGNPRQTPRYDYNQILYRLDLTDPRLQPAQPSG